LNFSAVANDEFLFVIGGFFHPNQGGQAAGSTDVYYLNGTKATTNITSMNVARGYTSSIMYDDRFVVVVGGAQSLSSPFLSTIEVLDIEKGEWTLEQEELPFNCSRPSLTVYQTGIVITCDGSSLVVVFYMVNGSTSLLPSLPTDSCAGTIATIDDSSLIYICSQNESWILNPLEGWTSNTNLFGWDGFNLNLQSPMTQINTYQSMFAAFDTYGAFFTVFVLANNSINFYPCIVVDSCFGQLLFYSESFVCVENSASSSSTLRNSRLSYQITSNSSSYGWSTYMANSQRTGQSGGFWDCFPLDSSSALLWTVTLPYGVYVLMSSPVIPSSEEVILSTYTETYLINASSGAIQDSLPDGSSSSVALGSYYTSGLDGVVVAVSTGTGYLTTINMWKSPVTPTLYSEIGIGEDGSVYYCDLSSSTYKLDGNTGAPIWQTPIPGSICSGVSVGNDAVYVTSVETDTIYALRQADGGIIWQQNFKEEMLYSVPSVSSNGLVYTASMYTLFAIEAPNGTIRWQYNIHPDQFIYSPIAIGPDNTIFTSSAGKKMAFDGETGALKWKRHMPFEDCQVAGVGSAVIAADHTVYFGCAVLYALDYHTGSVKWQYVAGGSPAMGPDGTIVIADSIGGVRALRGRASDRWVSISLTNYL